WSFDVIAFESPDTPAARIEETAADLARFGISYHWMRRRSSHRLEHKIAEATRALVQLCTQALRRRPPILHARSHLPAAVARAAAAVIPGVRFLFDLRGLLGEEYVDAGHWRSNSLRYRLLKRAERDLLAQADGLVVLTERVRAWLTGEAHLVHGRT